MVPLAVSSIVALVTAGAFVYLSRDLHSTALTKDDFGTDRNALYSSIMEEIRATHPLSSEHEAEFELLEERIKLMELSQAETEGAGSDASGASGAVPITVHEAEVVEESIVTRKFGSRDLIVEAHQVLENAGQHRPYTLFLHFAPKRAIPWSACRMTFEWPLPRNVFVDVWALRRLTVSNHFLNMGNRPGSTGLKSAAFAQPPIWTVKPRHPDLEVGAYDARRARPFLLSAEIGFAERSGDGDEAVADLTAPWRFELKIPDVMVRYQTPKTGSACFHDPKAKAPYFYLPAPQLHFTCPGNGDESTGSLDVELRTHRLRPIPVTLPVAVASSLPAFVTVGSIVLGAASILLALAKC